MSLKHPDDMDVAELNTLPEFRQIYYVEVEDWGERIRVPRSRTRQAYFVGPKTPITWPDVNGNMWSLVKTPEGWMKERM